MCMLILCALFTAFGVLLGFAARSFRIEGNPLAERIDALLPQTQCGQCGYPGCRPYADAIARGDADIDLCPPGGEAGMRALAELLGSEIKPLTAAPPAAPPQRVAVIDEMRCIGCTRCIQACPVDAIVGAPKVMHTVIASECTGCNLCVAPCPVDCIAMGPVQDQPASWKWPVTFAGATHCNLVAAAGELPGKDEIRPCIRCGACADACPAGLLPQQLYWYAQARNLERVQDYRLFDCIECGCCDVVCPSHIPLTQQFRAAKSEVLAKRHARERAEHARARYEARQQRKERERRQQAETASHRREALKKPGAAEIAAAIQRARARKEGVRPAPVSTVKSTPPADDGLGE